MTQLETFRRLARELNFTRTAEALDLTQPAVTQQIRALADHFDVRLFDMVGRKTVLTDAGEFLALRAETLLENVAALERDMREFADVRAGELRLGATVTIGAYVLPDLIATFHKAHPTIRLSVEIENTQAMAEAVKAGRVSLALVEGPLDDAELEITAFASDELVVVAAPQHPLASEPVVTVTDLAACAFVVREMGSGTRAQVESALATAGVTMRIALALPTGEGIVRAVERDIGIAVLSQLVVADALRQGRLVRIAIAGLAFHRTLRLVRRRRQTPSPAAMAFTRLTTSTRA